MSSALASKENREWLEDCALRFMCVFALDRFGDFVSDTVHLSMPFNKKRWWHQCGNPVGKLSARWQNICILLQLLKCWKYYSFSSNTQNGRYARILYKSDC